MTTTMISLTTDQVALLKLLAKAYEQPTAWAKGQKQEIHFSTSFGGTRIQHPALERDEVLTALGDIEELHDLSLISIRHGSSMHAGSIRVTGNGYEAVSKIDEQERAIAEAEVVPTEGRRMGLDWQTEVFPVLKAVNDLFPSAPPHKGVSQKAINAVLDRDEDDEHTDLVLSKLAEAEYVTSRFTASGVLGPLFCQPTEKALELLAGWPTQRPDAVLARLITALEQQIEEAEDDEQKGKLRTALTGLREIGQGVAVSAIAQAMFGS